MQPTNSSLSDGRADVPGDDEGDEAGANKAAAKAITTKKIPDSEAAVPAPAGELVGELACDVRRGLIGLMGYHAMPNLPDGPTRDA